MAAADPLRHRYRPRWQVLFVILQLACWMIYGLSRIFDTSPTGFLIPALVTTYFTAKSLQVIVTPTGIETITGTHRWATLALGRTRFWTHLYSVEGTPRRERADVILSALPGAGKTGPLADDLRRWAPPHLHPTS